MSISVKEIFAKCFDCMSGAADISRHVGSSYTRHTAGLTDSFRNLKENKILVLHHDSLFQTTYVKQSMGDG